MKKVYQTKNSKGHTVKIYVHNPKERAKGASMGFTYRIIDGNGVIIKSSGYFTHLLEAKNSAWNDY
jgi:hypothetical protein